MKEIIRHNDRNVRSGRPCMKQLFYLLVPLGAAVLIFSIRGVIGAVKAKLLYEQALYRRQR